MANLLKCDVCGTTTPADICDKWLLIRPMAPNFEGYMVAIEYNSKHVCGTSCLLELAGKKIAEEAVAAKEREDQLNQMYPVDEDQGKDKKKK